MREILFKAISKQIGKWVEGGFLETKYGSHQTMIIVDTEIGVKFIEVHPETVCQYIGRKDKNKVNIFEGDKIKTLNTEYIVKWNDLDHAWILLENGCSHPLYIICRFETEVIGSIHDKAVDNV